MWSVVDHPDAEGEYKKLGFPHSSAVKGADKLR